MYCGVVVCSLKKLTLIYAVTTLFIALGLYFLHLEHLAHSNIKLNTERIIKINCKPKPTYEALADVSEPLKKWVHSRKQTTPQYYTPLEISTEALPQIAIILTGVDSTATEAAVLGVDRRIAIGLSPYIDHANDVINFAVTKGYEVYLHLPMVSGVRDKASSLLLKAEGPEDTDNLRKLHQILSISKNITGVYSDAQEIFTSSTSNATLLFETLRNRGLKYIYGGSNNKDSLNNIAQSLSLGFIDVDVSASSTNDSNIRHHLLKLENIARERGYAMGKFNASASSVKVLKDWLKTLNASKLGLVSPKDLLNFKQKESRTSSTMPNLCEDIASGDDE